MALQDILNKILETADTEVKEINKSLETEKEALSKKIGELEKDELAAFEIKSKEALVSVETKTNSMARRENKKRLLDAKRDIIEKSLSAFLVSLEDSKDDLYGKIIEKLLQKVDVLDGTIFVPKNRVEITKSLVENNLEVAADDTIKGGFIVKNKEVTVDNTFANLVNSEFKNELEIYFSTQLKLA